MQLSDFSFEVPDSLIAQQPGDRRDGSRLMLLDGANATFEHHQFTRLPDLLRAGDRLVFNNTKVIKARLYGRKESGGKVELMIDRVIGHNRALTKIRASKSPKPGSLLIIEESVSIRVTGRQDDLFEIAMEGGMSVAEVLERHGQLPLPPYIQRRAAEEDGERYQTVYAEREGAVAAPTAGLHFTEGLFSDLAHHQIDVSFLTLHVGSGTFQPVRQQNLDDHVMHSEYAEITADVVKDIQQTKDKGGRIIAVGTTSMRTLESASVSGSLEPMAGDTQLFLRPGAEFKTVDGLITNFHLSESTLLMLVCAFAGTDLTLRAYREAVQQAYRFFSYGDAMLVWPDRMAWGAQPSCNDDH